MARRLIDSAQTRIALVSLAELRSHASDTRLVLRGTIDANGYSCFETQPEENSLYNFAKLFPRSKEFAHVGDFDQAHLRWEPPEKLLEKVHALERQINLKVLRRTGKQITFKQEGHAIEHSKTIEIVTKSLTSKPLPEKIYKGYSAKSGAGKRLEVLIAIDTSATILWDHPSFLENSIAEIFALRHVFEKHGLIVRTFACMDIEDTLYKSSLKSGIVFEIGRRIVDLVPFLGRESLRMHILLHMIKLSEQSILDWLGVRKYKDTRDFESSVAQTTIREIAKLFRPDILVAYTNADIRYQGGLTWRLGLNRSIDSIVGVL
ncbi:MAG: hypothetical protein D6750_10320 [Bacteroidetes bacterium]|jgi:hypothetical protein|nr:MAG: hypothetical protein D6750_10320 [Bacteroidota bacterium]